MNADKNKERIYFKMMIGSRSDLTVAISFNPPKTKHLIRAYLTSGSIFRLSHSVRLRYSRSI